MLQRSEVQELQSLLSLLEGKDVGRFKGDISVYKQRELGDREFKSGLHKKLGKKTEDALGKLIDKTEKELLQLIRRYKSEDEDRKISLTRLKTDCKAVLRIAYDKAYDLGTEASGITQDNKGLKGHKGADEKAWLAGIYSQEQKYFNSFIKDIASGESIARIEMRVANYAAAIRSVYEAARALQVPDDVLIYWDQDASDNPCTDCRLLAKLSPYTKETLPTTPRSGTSRCYSNCRCRLRYVKASPEEIDKVKRKNKSSEYLLRKLRKKRS